MTLTTSLALLGAAVLVALLLHGWWQMRRGGGRSRGASGVEKPFRRSRIPGATAAAAGAERVDPSMDGGAAGAEGPDTVPDLPPSMRPGARGEPRLDALIDVLVPLVLESPVSGDAVLAHLPGSRRVGTKTFAVEGLSVTGGEWEPLHAGGRYSELQMGVQMANRRGPINEIEYSEALQKAEALADAVGARVEAPDMLEVVNRARELDAQTAPLDAQISLRLVSEGVAWSVPYLQQIAARHGFVPATVSGRWVLPSQEAESAPPVLVLSIDARAALADDAQAASVRECVLTLDVPQTPEAAEPYPLMYRTSTALADDLGAKAVDDEGRVITLHAFNAIGHDLEQLYRRLEALDLQAGTPAARRLFS